MSRMLAGSAGLLGLLAALFFALGASDHAHTITVTKQGNTYKADKPDKFEVDFAHKTTFTIVNNTDDDLDFMLTTAAKQNAECRVYFDPAGTADCASTKQTIEARQQGTLSAGASDMGFFEYSWFFGRPKFKSDVMVGKSGDTLHKVDPDLELERDIGTVAQLIALIASILTALMAWLTRRRV